MADSVAEQPEQQATVPFHARHQAGIATPAQRHLTFVAFDVTTGTRTRLRGLLRRWTAAGAALTAGAEFGPGDPGEALGLPPARLTLTFGFGPSLFETSSGRSRFGLSAAPPALAPLPAFAGEVLDPASSGGDVCVQACADDPQVAFHAVHVLAELAGTDARLRWIQQGFRGTPAQSGQTSRNLIGFKDGTNNLSGQNATEMRRFVWAADPGWMRGGTYAVVRRIEIVLSGWDDLSLAEQEQAIGRHKRSGAPLGARREHDPVDLAATDAHGNLLIPSDAHVRIASPQTNGGQRILRRGYPFSRGMTAGTVERGGHQLDGGLFFIAFARDPRRQVIPLLEKVSTADAISSFTIQTASAIFACPPGARVGGFVGEQLLA